MRFLCLFLLLSGCAGTVEQTVYYRWAGDGPTPTLAHLERDFAGCEYEVRMVRRVAPQPQFHDPDPAVAALGSAVMAGGTFNQDVDLCMAARGWRLTER